MCDQTLHNVVVNLLEARRGVVIALAIGEQLAQIEDGFAVQEQFGNDTAVTLIKHNVLGEYYEVKREE